MRHRNAHCTSTIGNPRGGHGVFLRSNEVYDIVEERRWRKFMPREADAVVAPVVIAESVCAASSLCDNTVIGTWGSEKILWQRLMNH